MASPRWTGIFTLVTLACRVLAATADSPEPVETLLIDPRIRYHEDGSWTMMSEAEVDLRRRQVFEAPPSVTTTFQIAVSTATEQDKATSTVSASPLPSPLDGTLSTNWTTAEDGSVPCPVFINSFLTDERFKQCYPLSMLIQGSRSFFNAEKSLVSTTQVLDATCHANATFCNGYLADLARNLTAKEHCGTEYQQGHPTIRNSYAAMVSYAPIYSAGCLKDPQTSMYCYANAATNTTNPGNMYMYYLALNMSLPGSAVPTCNQCLQQTMNIFHQATGNRKQLIVNTYEKAAKQVNLLCGPGFVEEQLAVEIRSSSGLRTAPASSLWMVTSVTGLALLLHWML
ncbi:hypothetical protein OQA88_10404 [Cercophora sp. LCS_1]